MESVIQAIKNDIKVRIVFYNFVKNSNVMDIQTRKLHFIESFLQLQNEKVIAKLESLLQSENDTMENASLLEYNNDLNQANERIENGSFYTSEEIKNSVGQWK